MKLPRLDPSRLTFGEVLFLLEDLLSEGSQGAYEQFAVAALLQALVEQIGIPGYRVETKSLNASDRSSRTAGDVQILVGNRVLEAYEVTAGDWRTKVVNAGRILREHDLSRLHVIAPVADYTSVVEPLRQMGTDVSLVDLRSFLATLTAALTRPQRSAALERLYELLDRHQPDVHRVNRYVRLLQERGLTLSAE